MRRRLTHGRRAQKDDIAALVRPHDGNHQAGQPHRAHQQELVGFVPLIFAQVLNTAIGDVPRIDDEDIDSAKSFTDLGDKLLDRPTIGNVRPRCQHTPGVGGAELGAGSGQCLVTPTANGDSSRSITNRQWTGSGQPSISTCDSRFRLSAYSRAVAELGRNSRGLLQLAFRRQTEQASQIGLRRIYAQSRHRQPQRGRIRRDHRQVELAL